MNDDLLDVKQLVYLDVLTLIASGKTKKAACEQKDIAEITFDRWLAANKQAKEDFIATIRSKYNERYTALSATRGAVVDKIIERINLRLATEENPSIDELFQMDRDLARISNAMELQLGVLRSDDPGAASAEAMFITGPSLRRGSNKITKATVTMEFENEKPIQIVDAESEPSQAQE